MSLSLATRGYTGTRGALGTAAFGYTPVVGPYVPPPPKPIIVEDGVDASLRRRRIGRSSNRIEELSVAAAIKAVNGFLPQISVAGSQKSAADDRDITVQVIFERIEAKSPIVITAVPIKVPHGRSD